MILAIDPSTFIASEIDQVGKKNYAPLPPPANPLNSLSPNRQSISNVGQINKNSEISSDKNEMTK